MQLRPGPDAPLVGAFLSRAVPTSLLAPCLPEIARELGTGHAGVGSLMTTFYVGYTLAVLAVAPLSARFGRRALLLAGTGLLWMSTLAMALAPDLDTARLAAFFFGVAGMGDLTATVLLVDGPRPGRRISWGHSAFALGAVLVPMASGAALEAGIGYRPQFVAAAGLNLLEFAWVLALPALGRGVAGPAAPRPVAVSWRAMLAVLALGGLYVVAETGAWVWIPTWMRERFGIAPGVAALAVSVLWVTMFAGRLALGPLLDRANRGRLLAGLAIGAAASSALLLAAPSAPWAFAAVVGLGLSLSAVFPSLQVLASRRHPGASETVLGRMAAACGLAGAFGPGFVGAVSEVLAADDPGTGLTAALALVPVALVLFAVLAVAVARGTSATPPSGDRSATIPVDPLRSPACPDSPSQAP